MNNNELINRGRESNNINKNVVPNLNNKRGYSEPYHSENHQNLNINKEKSNQSYTNENNKMNTTDYTKNNNSNNKFQYDVNKFNNTTTNKQCYPDNKASEYKININRPNSGIKINNSNVENNSNNNNFQPITNNKNKFNYNPNSAKY